MLAVIGFSHRDFKQAQELLKWIAELDAGMPQHKVLLVASSQVPEPEIKEALRLAQKAFRQASAIRQREVEERGRPYCTNRMFQLSAEHVRDIFMEPFLWLEPDAVPLRPGWLDKLEQEYKAAAQPFMGFVYHWVNDEKRQPHLTGNAIYPPNISTYNPWILRAQEESWDVTKPEITLRHTHVTHLILHDWAVRNPQICYEFPTQDVVDRLIPKSAVLFHSSKSGDLIARLRERMKPRARAPLSLDEKLKGTTLEFVRQKLQLKDVTLVCADTARPDLAWRGVKACMDRVDFGGVKFFTNTNDYPRAVKMPELLGTDGYSRFMIEELHRHIETSHVLVCQWDGFVLNADGWKDEFLDWDYVGAPWKLPTTTRRVGNGGFSLRSTRLLKEVSALPAPYHPEDQVICIRHGSELEALGMRFAPENLAALFSCEMERYEHQFGFHSYQTKLPGWVERPVVFHHSGLVGDILYACAAMADFGLSALYISDEVRGPDNGNSAAFRRENRYNPQELAEKLFPLLRAQPYIADCRMSNKVPLSTDIDFNLFRANYEADGSSLLRKQCAISGASWPEGKPWLSVDFEVTMPKRPIVVHRSPRHHNERFDWRSLVARYGSQMVMVGSAAEHADFARNFGGIPHLQTTDLLSLARVIAGAKVFIGNQSAPMALALGLGKPVVQEVFEKDPNCELKRTQAIYSRGGEVEIPRCWL